MYKEKGLIKCFIQTINHSGNSRIVGQDQIDSYLYVSHYVVTWITQMICYINIFFCLFLDLPDIMQEIRRQFCYFPSALVLFKQCQWLFFILIQFLKRKERKKWHNRLLKLWQISANPGLYLALILDCKSDIIPVSLLPSAWLQLWPPDAVGQRPQPHPHEQLQLQLGDHRGLGGQWRDGPRSVDVLMAVRLICSRFPRPPGCESVKKRESYQETEVSCEVNKKIFCFLNGVFLLCQFFMAAELIYKKIIWHCCSKGPYDTQKHNIIRFNTICKTNLILCLNPVHSSTKEYLLLI